VIRDLSFWMGKLAFPWFIIMVGWLKPYLLFPFHQILRGYLVDIYLVSFMLSIFPTSLSRNPIIILKKNYFVLFSGCFFVFILSCSTISARELPTYTIYQAQTPIIIDGHLDEPAWTAAPDVGSFSFPWWKSGKTEKTLSKLLWDKQNIYVSFIAEDSYMWGEKKVRDSAVFTDDCVEVFTAPNPDDPQRYFNIEMNVIGTFLDQFHPKGPGVNNDPEWNGEGIKIATSFVGTLNNDSDIDQYWILEVAIPLINFQQVAKNIPPKPGDIWRLNLNRLGGKTNAQYSQWSPSQTEKPQFHSPKDFGRVIFSDVKSPFWRS
jgi:Carbohydrate-binding family 9